MRKLTIAAGAVALSLGTLLLPSLAQHTGRTITRETFSEPSDFVRAGGHVLNRSHIAYVARTGNQTTVYFVGNVPPLVLVEGGEELAARLAPGNDPNPPTMPDMPPMPSPSPRSPFDINSPAPPNGRGSSNNWEGRPTRRVLPSPGAPEPEPELKPVAPTDPTLPTPPQESAPLTPSPTER